MGVGVDSGYCQAEEWRRRGFDIDKASCLSYLHSNCSKRTFDFILGRLGSKSGVILLCCVFLCEGAELFFGTLWG